MRLFVFLGLLVVSIQSAVTSEWVVRVGALFNVFDKDGFPDFDQVQALSAFIMGINEVNTNATVIGKKMQLEWTMPDLTYPTDGHGFEGAARQAEYLASKTTWPSLASGKPAYFIGSYASPSPSPSLKYVATETSSNINASHTVNGVDIVVGGMGNIETMTHDGIFADRKLIQVHTLANDTRLGSGVDFPYKLGTTPVESFQGMVFQQIICGSLFSQNMNTSRIVIFFNPTEYGIKARMENQDGTYCGVEVLAQLVVQEAPRDYSAAIKQIIKLDVSPRFFIFHTNAMTASQIIAQGSDLGLFGSDVQLWGPAGVTVPLLVNNNQTGTTVTGSQFFTGSSSEALQAVASKDQIARHMKGYLGIRYAPSYGLRGKALGGTDKGTQFVQTFKNIDITSTTNIHCGTQDSLQNYVFRRGGVLAGACVFDTAFIKVASFTQASVSNTIVFDVILGTLHDGMLISWMTGSGTSSGTSTRVSCLQSYSTGSGTCTIPSGVTLPTIGAGLSVNGAFYISTTLKATVSSTTLTVSKVFSGSLKAGMILVGGDPSDSSKKLTSLVQVTTCSTPTSCTLSATQASLLTDIYVIGVFSFKMFVESDGRAIYPWAPHAYDAIYSVGHGVRLLDKSNSFTSSSKSWDSFLLSKVMMVNVSHEGASGHIHYFEGMAEYGGYAQGNREQGHTFTLWNFNSDGFLSGQTNHSVFNYVGTWSIKTEEDGFFISGGITFCEYGVTNSYYADRDWYYPCSPVQFNTQDGKIPSINSPYHYDTPPRVIKIGGIFTNVNEDTGEVDVNQAQGLAAFLMAVEDVNAAFGAKFKFRHALASGVGFSSAVKGAEFLLNRAFSETGVDIVVSAAGNVETEAALKMLEADKVVQVHAFAQETELGSGDNFPYKVQTVPSDSFQGMVLQSILCQVYHYAKTSVWASSNEMGTKSAIESGDGTYCDITKITTHLVRFNTGLLEDGSGYDLTAWDQEIDIALEGGARIFLIFMPPETAAGLLVRGFQRGLFKENTQIFLNALGLTPLLAQKMEEITQSKDMVKRILKGAIAIKFAPAFHWRYPASFLAPTQPVQDSYHNKAKQAHQFVDAFRQRTSTAGTPGDSSGSGIITCDQDRDDSSRSFLWREQGHLNLSSQQILCSGVDFSKFTDPNGADIWPYTAYVYDAVWSLAYAMDKLLDDSIQCTVGTRCLDGDTIMDLLMNHVNFTGASGFTMAFPGMPFFAYYARGNREEGHFYTYWNFQPELYDTSAATTGGFAYTGYWYIAMGTGTVTFCTDEKDTYQDYYGPTVAGDGSLTTHKCYPIIYNTFDGKPAPDTPPVIIIYIPDGANAFLIVLAVLTAIISLLCLAITYEYGFTRLIKASQAEMMYILFLGGLLAAGRIFAAGMKLSDASCGSLIWLGHLCFWFVFASLSIKTYRIHRIINNKGFKRIRFSKEDTMIIFCGVLFSVIIYLILETVVGEVHMAALSSTVSNQRTDQLICTFKYTQFNTTLYVLELLCLIFSARMTWAIKDAPDSVNESKFIALAMGVIFLLILLVMPVVYLLDLVPWQKEIIASVFFGVGAISAQLIIILPKATILLRGMDVGGIEGKLVEQQRPAGSSQIISMATASLGRKQVKVAEKEEKKAIKAKERHDAQNLMIQGLHINGTYEDKVRIGREQLVMWRAYIMHLEQTDSGSGSGSGSTSNLGHTHGSTRAGSTGEEGDSIEDAHAPFRRTVKSTVLDPVLEDADTAELTTLTKTDT